MTSINFQTVVCLFADGEFIEVDGKKLRHGKVCTPPTNSNSHACAGNESGEDPSWSSVTWSAEVAFSFLKVAEAAGW